jgi:hypothetical protein
MAKKTIKKKNPSWEVIGKKVETDFKSKDFNCCTPMTHVHHCSGFAGRLIFVIGILYVMSYAGWFANIPAWPVALMGIGFALMKL